MKTKTNYLSLIMSCVVTLSFLGCVCMSAGAQTKRATAPEVAGHHVQRDITKWDVNQNERLDGDELAAMQRAKIRERQEQQEARAKAVIEARKLDEAARRTRMVSPTQIKQYDTNTNGSIDLDERHVCRAN